MFTKNTACKIATMLILLFLILSLTAKAQVRIAGKIMDNRGKPVNGVSITLNGTYDGATTDSLGNFSFLTTEKGKIILQTSIIGYRPFEQELTIGSNPITVNIAMKELVTELKAVVISAGSFVASDKNKGAVLTALDIVTTPSANGDVTSAFKTLPGTQQVGESEGLFVRGGSATESKIYMDGNLVNNFFYSSTPGLPHVEDLIHSCLKAPFSVLEVIRLYMVRPFLQH